MRSIEAIPLRDRILELYQTKTIDMPTLEHLIVLLNKVEAFGGGKRQVNLTTL